MTDQVLSGRDLLAPEERVKAPGSGGAGFLVFLGVLAMGGGAISVTPATIGVYLVGTACFFAILARMLQASSQHAQMMRAVARPIDAP